jgi:hypothetical protein
MASLNLTKLKPGKTYVVKVRAVDEDGNYSQYSFNYSFTVPATKADGTQLTSTNNTVVTALARSSSSVTGGALTAGGLDANGISYAGKAQLSELWNGTASAISSLTGTASTGAVIINSTGILGYQFSTTSSGQAQFFLNTADGNAYFRGTIYAGAGQVGGWTIGSTSISSGKLSTNLLSIFDPSAEIGSWSNYWTASYTSITDPSNSIEIIQSDGGYQDPYSFGFYIYEYTQSGSIVNPVALMYKSASALVRFSAADLNIVSNGNYVLSAYCKLNEYNTFGSSSVILKIERYSASTGGTLLGTASSALTSISSTSSWTRISASVSASTTDYFRFSLVEQKTLGWSYVSSYSVPSNTFSIEWDKLQLESGTTPTGYSAPGGALTLSTNSSSPAFSIFSDAPGARTQTVSFDLSGAQTGTSLALSSGISVQGDSTVYGVSRLRGNVSLGTSGGTNTLYSYGSHYFREITAFSKKATFNSDVTLGNSSTDSIVTNGYVRSPLTTYYTSTGALLVQSGTGVNMLNVSTSTTKYVQINNSLRTSEALSVLGDISYSGTLVNASSRKFKKEITVVDIPDSILNINPVTFVYDESKTQVAETGMGKVNFGLIAEEFEENGVPEVVVYNEDGTVQGLDYSKISALLFPLVRRQKEKIEELENRIALLENK